jgi:hypothetical protein
VPIASVITAAITSLAYTPSAPGDEVPIFGIAWGCAALISVLGMGAALAVAIIQGRGQKAALTHQAMRDDKPSFDPDAYDFVSSRG